MGRFSNLLNFTNLVFLQFLEIPSDQFIGIMSVFLRYRFCFIINEIHNKLFKVVQTISYILLYFNGGICD